MQVITASQLLHALDDARSRTLACLEGLDADQLMGPRLPIVNPMHWEIGHVAWFYEHWILRRLDARAPLLAQADALYDSSAVPHDTRWDLPLPSIEETLRYYDRVHAALTERLESRPLDARSRYFYQLTIFHADMHNEAFTFLRQTLGYPPPAYAREAPETAGERPCAGDVAIPGGRFILGAPRDTPFVFDNEKWAHAVELEPFHIARSPVTNAEYAAFVEDEGYTRHEYWDDAGWAWRQSHNLEHPVCWRRGAAGWEERWFDRWLPLAAHRPVVHVSWHEASAYCRYAGRRLPSEAEWELAAAGEPVASSTARKRDYPWGDKAITGRLANLGAYYGGRLDVGALPEGDSAHGCRQLLGNVWEWTTSAFVPYPGFAPDPYRDYSQPWFGTHRVLRGGSWVTPARLIHNTFRNFYTPERNDLYAGFRTCAR